MKDIATTPAKMRVMKRARDMALARRRLGKTSVPTTYTSGEKPRENEPIMPQIPAMVKVQESVTYESETDPNDAARPIADSRSIGRRPTRSKSWEEMRRNSTLLAPAAMVACKDCRSQPQCRKLERKRRDQGQQRACAAWPHPSD
eukprot:scaffold165684_cov32-Tisochrysis_lutea.AAC.2